MPRSIDDFWKILDEIQGKNADLTDAVTSIARNEKTVAQNLFSNVIDQISYNSRDYERIRSFLRDWYAAHRTVTTYQANISDVYQMPNDQLDDLFRSFGYDYSTGIRDPVSNNTSLNKVNFFLDIVNLYKIKGTPQALVDVLQYYGIVDVDLYEMSLQFEDRPAKTPDDLVFKGKVVSGTTGDGSPIYLPFDLLTQGDPHWLQTEADIRVGIENNIINFPSQSPYFIVKPLFDEEATDAATSILQRYIQDQYTIWTDDGQQSEDTNPILPQDAIISITGDQCSLLTLCLSCIYIFNKQYRVGSPATKFVCYDGTSTESADIIEEFREMTSKPTSRQNQKDKYAEYLDQFTRDIVENFLQVHSDAETTLAILNPIVKMNLDGLTTDIDTILGTLLKDLGEWGRSNISYGFINMSYILFGMDSLFGQLRDVVEFFKPYRARLIPLEMLQFRNRLLNTIVVEDKVELDGSIDSYDYLVGDSTPCCMDSTCLVLSSPRELYDCGSYHDIGSVTDISKEVQIDIVQFHNDYFRCPSVDTTGYVTSEIIREVYILPQTLEIPIGADSLIFSYEQSQSNINYSLVINIFNKVDSTPSIIPYVIRQKTTTGFYIEFDDTFDSDNYYLAYDIIDQTNLSGIEMIVDGADEVSVSFGLPKTNVNYSIGVTLENLLDPTTSYYLYTVTEKTIWGFKVKFSSPIDSTSYTLAWATYDYARQFSEGGTQDGWNKISAGANTKTIAITPPELFDNYTLVISIVNISDPNPSNYAFIVTEKTVNEFTIQLSSPTDSGNYWVSWACPLSSSDRLEDFLYRQTGQMRDYDTEGTFDCTHGQDQIDIEIEDVINFMMQESGSYLLEENSSKIMI